MKKKILLIGGSGFVGQYLKEYYPEAILMSNSGTRIDVRDIEGIKKAISEFQPYYVIHLAAQSSVPESIKNPYETFEINFIGTLNILKALEFSNFTGRMLYIGSGEVYGLLEENDLPVFENKPLKPRSPYAVSKVAAEALCYQWSQTSTFELVITRPFNHIGPGQSDRFAIPNFAKQIIEIKLDKKEAV